MGHPIDGRQLGAKLLKALRLPEKTVWFELRCAVDEIVTVKCAYRPEVDQEEVELILSEYEVVLKETE